MDYRFEDGNENQLDEGGTGRGHQLGVAVHSGAADVGKVADYGQSIHDN